MRLFGTLVCSLLLFATVPTARPQATRDPTPLTFDIVSIRPSAGVRTQGLNITPDGYEAIGFQLQTTLLIAYAPAPFFKHLDDVKGLPSWALGDKYDIQAKVALADAAQWRSLNTNIMRTSTTLQHMLQVVLEERCNLHIHGTAAKSNVYALHLPAKSAALVEDATVPAEGHGTPLLDGARFVFSSADGEKTYTFYNTSMAVLATFLSTFSQYPVVDKTGLQGRYKFILHRTPAEPASPDAAPSIDMPIPFDLRTLGMKVETEKVDSTVWVIDSIERPSAN